MIMIDCIARQVPGVLGDINSLEESRNASPDVYTRPESLGIQGKEISSTESFTFWNHKLIEEWRGEAGWGKVRNTI
jgi:tRNA G37 N-methylase TrmD